MSALQTDSQFLLAVFLFYTAIGVICLAAGALVRAFRKAARVIDGARPPVPGQPQHETTEAVTRTAPSPPVLRAAPAPGSRSYRAPPPGNFGICVETRNTYDSGVIVTYDHLRYARAVEWPALTSDELGQLLGGDP
jgi:hypothetical protein